MNIIPHITLECTRCSRFHTADIYTLACNVCGAPLQVQYTKNGPTNENGIPTPLVNGQTSISLGEGRTPIIPLNKVGVLLGIRRLFAKLEMVQPTGSFKDRGTAVMISFAHQQGIHEIVEDSSGNAGASIAAYAAQAGIKAHIFTPSSVSGGKLRQIRAFGANTHLIDGPRENTASAALDYCSEHNLPYTSHALSPYFLEGTKTFAYEVTKTTGNSNLPSHIVFPVGNGGLLIGAWIGFNELRAAGHIDAIPRLHAVQTSSFAPIASVCSENQWEYTNSDTVASGIAIRTPVRKNQIIEALSQSKGTAVAVKDREILLWRKTLSNQEGVFAEPTAAAVFAGIERLVSTGIITSDETVLVPVTGAGLKDDTPI